MACSFELSMKSFITSELPRVIGTRIIVKKKKCLRLGHAPLAHLLNDPLPVDAAQVIEEEKVPHWLTVTHSINQITASRRASHETLNTARAQ